MKKKKYNMYKKAGCSLCNYKGYTIKTIDPELSFWVKKRCECSLIKTKKYKKALKSDTITKKEFDKFFDNNSYCNDEDNETYRSW